MKNQRTSNRAGVTTALVAVSLLLLAPIALFAQGDAARAADLFAGTYKGTAKSTAGNVELKIEIKSHDSELFGKVSTPRGEEVFSPSHLADGKLKIALGTAAAPETLVLQIRDGKLVGAWQVGKETRAVEFERVSAVNSPPAGDPISGEWDASADAQGQAFPFTLVLKVEGEKVSGSSNSQLGDSTISSGVWKDGKLAVVLDGASGQVALMATLVDGKLSGDYDFSGQVQGKWVAVKKKP